MGGGKSNTSQTSMVRFAPYIENRHQQFFDLLADRRDDALVQNPFDPEQGGYDPTEFYADGAFFGAGYFLTSYPSIYDMYGKFMAGLDIEVLFDESFEDTVNGPVVSNVIKSEADILADDLIQTAIPRFETGMRDINSVMTSSFIVGRALMETARTKAISRFSADFRGKLLPIVAERWRTHLEWNKSVVEMYAQLLKFYISARFDIDNHKVEWRTKRVLWPFTVLEYDRVALGALVGAQNSKTEVQGASKAQKAIGGAMIGAGAGAMVGSAAGPVGTAVGALVGGLLGLAGGLA